MANLTKIESIESTYVEKLKETGITTTEALLERGSSLKGRQEICRATGISEEKVLRLVNLSDLFRIKGIGDEYSDLLEAAGVDTVPEMATRNAKNLYETLVTINQERNIVRQVPSQTTINKWIENAKTLPRVIKY
jgi:predicted flap endonuclease-1-like 5' DNA nuclease